MNDNIKNLKDFKDFLPLIPMYSLAVWYFKAHGHGWIASLYLPVVYCMGFSLAVMGFFLVIAISFTEYYRMQKRKEELKKPPNIYRVVKEFLPTLSLEQKKTLFSKYKDDLKITYNDKNNYPNRDLLTQELKDFFDIYQKVESQDWCFSNQVIAINQFHENYIDIGTHEHGKMNVKKGFNSVFYSEESQVLNKHDYEDNSNIYDFILYEIVVLHHIKADPMEVYNILKEQTQECLVS